VFKKEKKERKALTHTHKISQRDEDVRNFVRTQKKKKNDSGVYVYIPLAAWRKEYHERNRGCPLSI
jgi:hypothetical protein